MKRNVFRKSLAMLLGMTLTLPQMIQPVLAEDLTDEPAGPAVEEQQEETGTIYLDLSEGGSASFELKNGSKILFSRQTDGTITQTKGKKTKILESDHSYVNAYEGSVGEEITITAIPDDSHSKGTMTLQTGDQSREIQEDHFNTAVTHEDQIIVLTFRDTPREETEDSSEDSKEEADDSEDSDIPQESEETDESDPAEGASEDKVSEATSIEPDEPEDPFGCIAEASLLSDEELNRIDFSSRRLLVAGNEDLILDSEHVLSSYDGVYLLQYADEETVRKAFSYYYGKADFVDVDSVIHVAAGESGAAGSYAMTGDENPIAELENEAHDNPGSVKGTVIALIDTGINDMTNVIDAVSMIGDDPTDQNGHGTKMAGFIHEIDPDAKILSIKALGADGSGDASAVYAAIQYAIAKKVSIINLSLTATKKLENAAVEAAIEEAVANGIKVVGAAGNQGKNARYYVPGCIANAHIVGACDEKGQRIPSSNFGDTVDFNVVAESTSEATAKYSGYLSLGHTVADEKLVFPTDYVYPEDPEVPIDEDGDFHIAIGPNMEPSAPSSTIKLSEYLGINGDNIIRQMKAHETDTYYRTTPYQGNWDLNDPYVNLANNGDVNTKNGTYAAGMNCTGFVSRVLVDAMGGNGNDGPLRNMCNWVANNTSYSASGSFVNASNFNWFAVMYRGSGNVGIEHYWYKDINSLVNGEAGGFSYGGTSVPAKTYVPQKGDIIFCEINRDMYADGSAWGWGSYEGHVDPEGNSVDCHIGYYWGSKKGENKWWHSSHSENGIASFVFDDGTNSGNGISRIAPKCASIYMVIPMGGQEQTDIELTIHKNSGNPTVTDGNSEYDMTGIQYTVYTNSGCTAVAKDSDGKNAVFTLKKNGTANTVKLEAGKYWIKETLIPEGSNYEMSSTVYPVTLADTAVDLAVTDNPVTKDVKVKKVSSKTVVTDGNNSYNMTGVKYRVYTDQACTTRAKDADGKNMEMTLNAQGESSAVTLGYGKYWVKEYSVPAGSGYVLSSVVNSFTLSKASPAVSTITVQDPPLTDNMGLVIHKVDENGMTIDGVDMSGAEYTVRFYAGQYSKSSLPSSPSATWVIKTMKEGNDYTAVLDDAHKVSGDDAIYGKDISGRYILPLGTLTIEETKAPAGFAIDGSKLQMEDGNGSDSTEGQLLIHLTEDNGEVIVTSGNQTDDTKDGACLRSLESIIKGSIAVQKDDAERTSQQTQGDTDLSGIRFAIVNRTGHVVVVDEKEYASGQVVMIVTTDTKGYTSAARRSLPYGVYDVYELRMDASIAAGDPYDGSAKLGSSDYANASYRFGANEQKEIEIHEDGKVYPVSFQNNAVRGGVRIGKIDRETDANVPQGLATLKGAEFTIYNDSKKAVVVEGNICEPGEAVKVLTSAEDGTVETANDLLPYGSYYIKETKAPAGYLLNTDWKVNFQIREEGIIVDLSEDSVPDEIIRGDIRFQKIDIDGNPMAGIPFEIQRLDKDGNVVESHVIVSDEDGMVSTKSRSKTDDKVNSLDSYVSDGIFTDESKLDGTAGIWFGEQSARDDEQGALIYADYRIKELRCQANEGQDLLKTEDPIQIREDDVEVSLNQALVDLNILLESEAMDVMSDSKVVSIGEKVELSDTVSYIHLKTYNEYELVTTFYNIRKDGSAVELSSGTKAFTPEKTDNTKTAYGEVTNIVMVDTTKAEPGSTIVAVDKLYKVGDGKKTLVASHNTDYTVESQMLFVPEIRTEASDARTEDHIGIAEVEASVTDILIYRNLADQKIYRVTARLRDASTGEDITDPVTRLLRISYKANEVTEKDLYWQGPKDGTLQMPAFTFDASAMEGRTLVVTETLTDMDTNEVLLTHENLLDEDQSVHYIKVRTEAKDRDTGTHVGTVKEEATVIDRVTIENAIIGETYVITGSLVYQEDCKDSAGNEHKAGEVITEHEPVEVVAEDTTIVQELVFTLDASLLEGISGTVFEDVYHKDVLVGTHHDINSEPQTINWPKVRTTASDGHTGTHTGVCGENAVIHDLVHLTNLVVGDSYTVQGTLMDSEGKEFLVNGSPLVQTKEFTADASEMTVTMKFEFNASAPEGKNLVVFEKLFSGDVEVARHEDPADEGQTIHYPSGKTHAADSETKDHVGIVGELEHIVDSVEYHNLVPGETYTIKGQLIYREAFADVDGNGHQAGDPVLDLDGNPVTAETEFTAEQPNGTVDLVYDLDTRLITGTTVVVFEDCFSNGIKVISHADLNDDEQSVWYPSIRTTAIDAITEDHVGSAERTAVIRDKVELKNLKVGETYKVCGTLMDKGSGEAIIGPDGKNITSETQEFTADAPEMTITMDFTIDASIRENLSTVVFEELIHKNITVAAHADLEDEDQSIHHPSIRTTAKDDETGEHVGQARKETVIADEVQLSNLIPGMTYEVEGYLVDSNGGKLYLDAKGKEVRVKSEPFTAEKSEMSITLTFRFNGSNLEGRSVTVYEDLYHDGHLSAVHRLLNDLSQMVDYPKIHTNATDHTTGDHISKAGTAVTIIDEVIYENLRPGVTYTVKGTLMDKTTGEPLKVDGNPIIAEKEFVPNQKSGSIQIEFTFDASALAGRIIVAFEDLSCNGIPVAVHHDLEDEDQTVVIPVVRTSVKDALDGDRTVKGNTKVTLVDTVHMENLLTGRKYRVYGTLMNKKTGEVLMVNNKPITAASDIFTADNPEMDVDVTFELVIKEVADTDLIAFEKLFMIDDETSEEHEVGSHEDWDDKDQTIHVEKNKEPKNPKTGDTTRVAVPILITAGSLAGLILTCIVKKKGRAKV